MLVCVYLKQVTTTIVLNFIDTLIPEIEELSQSEKLELLKILAAQIPETELQKIFTASTYPIASLYHSTEAAEIMKKMIREDREASNYG
jgi:hypothetical protein